MGFESRDVEETSTHLGAGNVLTFEMIIWASWSLAFLLLERTCTLLQLGAKLLLWTELEASFSDFNLKDHVF